MKSTLSLASLARLSLSSALLVLAACNEDAPVFSVTCGDGAVAGTEGCDDGNVSSGDGCSARCGVEDGFVCEGEPSDCVLGEGDATDTSDTPRDTGGASCGDGEVSGSEGCDDGNRTPLDGCSIACQPEAGWTCEGSPSVCTPPVIEELCGDGVVTLSEGCDDGDTEPADGCDAACAVEPGWLCEGEPSLCALDVPEGCGDGRATGTEACDDGGNAGGDGCAADCTLEEGFVCSGTPSVCIPAADVVCGDGRRVGTEQCDDTNVLPGDGCSPTCGIEEGWTCIGDPSFCSRLDTESVCGDSDRAVDEACDDGNLVARDGCSESCEVESGWTCTGSPSTCVFDPCATVDCSALADSCRDAVCNPETGGCDLVPRAEGAGCDDGNLCTSGDVCVEGLCSGVALDCGGAGECGTGRCDPASGACVIEAAPDCAPCGDGEFCGGGVCGRTTSTRAVDFESGLPSDFSGTWLIDATTPHGGVAALRSQAIGNDGTTEVTTTVSLSTATEVSFWYRVESESGYDYLTFIVDGVNGLRVSNVTTWTRHAQTLAPGDHTLVWRYSKDISGVSGADAAWIDDLQLGTEDCGGNLCGTSVLGFEGCVVCAVADAGTPCDTNGSDCVTEACQEGACLPTPVADCSTCEEGGAGICGNGECYVGGVSALTVDFESGVPALVTTTAPAWSLDTSSFYSGASAFRSSAIGNNGTSAFEIVRDFPGPTVVTYARRVSSESCCDKLRFYVDGVERTNLGGDIAWGTESQTIPAGRHTLRWAYTKDSSQVGGSDAAWVDDIELGAGGGSCSSDACAVRVPGAEGCVICEVFADGLSCDDDAADCSSNACVAGECVATVFDDCSACGSDGTGTCGGGECYEGDASSFSLDFESGIPPELTTAAPAWRLDTTSAYSGASAFRSASIGNSATSSFEIVRDFSAETVLTYARRVSSESCCDKLRFYVDGTERTNLGGDIPWGTESQTIPAGRHTLRWAYTKDISQVSGDDAAWVDDIEFAGEAGSCTSDACARRVPGADGCVTCEVFEDGLSCDDDAADCSASACVAGECVATVFDDCTACGEDGASLCAGGTCRGQGFLLEEGFEGDEYPGFTTDGAAGWFIDAERVRTGSFSAGSGAVGDGGRSSAYLALDLPVASNLSFAWSVSSESGYDFLRFFIDGAQQFERSGEVDWTVATYALAAGSHTLEWRYIKDSSQSAGADRVFVDDILVEAEGGCVGNACTASVFDGTGCIECPLLADGDSCDGDASDCLGAACDAGECVVSGLPDCSTCGAGGSSICVGGTCGGEYNPRFVNFEDNVLPPVFVMSGNLPWIVNTAGNAGGSVYNLRSGAIGDGQTSTVSMSVETPTDGEVVFKRRVNSEATDDPLIFTIDGLEVLRWSGNVAWAEYRAPLAAGAHTLSWTYSRGATGAGGTNLARLDDLEFTAIEACTGAECAASAYDGATCVVCPAPDGAACTDGTCGAGECVAPAP